MSERTSARADRARLKALFSRAFGHMLFSREVEQREFAAAAGVSPSLVQRMADREQPEVPGLVETVLVGAARPALAADMLAWAADQIGLRVVAARTASGAGDLFALLGDALDAAHGVQRAVVDAVSPHGEDGRDVSTGELEAIVRKATDLERVATETRLAAQAELDVRTGGAAGGPQAGHTWTRMQS